MNNIKYRVFMLHILLLLCLLSCNNETNKAKKSQNKSENSILETNNNNESNKKNSIPSNPNDKNENLITIIAVGDIMLGSNYPNSNLLPNTNILKNTEHILKDADLTIGNLEGTLFDSGGTPKKCNNPDVCYVFRTPLSYGKYLVDAGFDYLSIANNHSNDFGSIGINETIKNLDLLNIKHSGIQGKNEYTILQKDGIKYGFVSFAPNSRTVKLNDYEYAKNLIKSTKSQVDVLIVMFHGGAEGAKYENVTRKTEIFHGENRGNVFKFARFAIDYGADLVFGQGPHVTRAVELYKGKFISYSAGNFATYGNFNLSGSNGIAPIFKITVNNSGNFVKGKIIPTKQNRTLKGPIIDKNNTVIKKIISLNKSDFPEGNGLIISENGEIEILK